MTIQTRKIGLNRGKNRIWLEGKILTYFGIEHGMRFDVVNSPNSLLILINPDGKRKIAGNKARPIIDMSAGTIDASEFVSRVVSVQPIKPGSNGNYPGIILTGIPVPLQK